MGVATLGGRSHWLALAFGLSSFALTSCGKVSSAGSSGSTAGATAHGGSAGQLSTDGQAGGFGPARSNGGSAGAGGDIVVNSTDEPPTDTRPPRPPWTPGFPLGAPGWKSSTTLICDPSYGHFSGFGVWADERGVFSLVAHTCPPDGEGSTNGDCTKSGLSLQLNAGTGWQSVFQSGPDTSGFDFTVNQLTGFPNGPILDLGNLQNQAGLWSIDHGVARSPGADVSVPDRVFVVDATTAYSVAGPSVYQYAGGAWSKLADVPADVVSIWADAARIVVAGTDSAVYQSPTSSVAFVTVPEAPLGYHGNLWGLGKDDIWTSYGATQMAHYDGSTWTLVDVSGIGQVGQLWGIDNVLFLGSKDGLGRISDGQLDVLLPPGSSNGGVQMTGLWGRSPADVFIALNDENDEQYACGGDFMIWFDGSAFHQF